MENWLWSLPLCQLWNSCPFWPIYSTEAQCKVSNFMSFCLRWLGTLNFRSLSRVSLIRIHFCSIAFIFHHSGGWEMAGFCTSEIKYKWQIYRWYRKQNFGKKTRVRELEVEECCGWNQSAGLGITSETWKPYLTFNKASFLTSEGLSWPLGGVFSVHTIS